MLDKLKRWYELLNKDGINSKKIVRKEIEKLIKEYQEIENDVKLKQK